MLNYRKAGGNMPGRGLGERMAIDPVRILPYLVSLSRCTKTFHLKNNPTILYLGARSGNGLWKSTNSGVTWSQVTSFPAVGENTIFSLKAPENLSKFLRLGTYIQDPSSEYTADIIGLSWVTFDKSSGSAGSTTPRIFVGVGETHIRFSHGDLT